MIPVLLLASFACPSSPRPGDVLVPVLARDLPAGAIVQSHDVVEVWLDAAVLPPDAVTDVGRLVGAVLPQGGTLHQAVRAARLQTLPALSEVRLAEGLTLLRQPAAALSAVLQAYDRVDLATTGEAPCLIAAGLEVVGIEGGTLVLAGPPEVVTAAAQVPAAARVVLARTDPDDAATLTACAAP